MQYDHRKIGEFCKVIGGYAFKSGDFTNSGVPVLKIKNISDKSLLLDSLDYLPELFLEIPDKYKVSQGDVLISMTGSHITMPASAVGRVARSRCNDVFLLNQRVGKMQVDKSTCSLDYLYYCMTSAEFKEQIGLRSRGAANQANVSGGDIEGIEIPFPTLPIQQKIAGILAAYDDLIENNLRRIKLLEEMAKITYEEWFVRRRFPGHESTSINSETGLPVGWKEVGLSEMITKLESGSRPKGGIDKNLNEGIPSVGAENVIGLGRYNYSSEKLVSLEFFSNMKRGRVCQKDILIYKDGAYIGKTSMFQDDFPHPICAVNEHVFLINSAKEFFQNYLFLTLSREDYYLKMQGLNSNAAQPGLNQEKLKSLSLIKPLDKNIEDFNTCVEPMIRSIFVLAKQNRLLQSARDILLPRLMTGVIDAESYDPAQLLKEAA